MLFVLELVDAPKYQRNGHEVGANAKCCIRTFEHASRERPAHAEAANEHKESDDNQEYSPYTTKEHVGLALDLYLLCFALFLFRHICSSIALCLCLSDTETLYHKYVNFTTIC